MCASEWDRLTPEEQLLIADHEIGNVSTVLAGLAHALDRRWDRLTDEERRQLVLRIAREADHLALVTRNLRVTRLDEHADEPETLVLHDDAGPAIRTMAAALEPVTRDHPYLVEVEEDLPPARFDVPRLEQVLLNLVTNAAKFGPPGTPIRVRARDDGGRLRIDVEDEGPGVPPELRSDIFGKFFRASRATSGMGLGLYIARMLMRSMGGEIWVEDGPSGGARFSVLLPGRRRSLPS